MKKRELFIKEAGNRSIEKGQFISILKKLNLYQNIDLIDGNILETVPRYTSENRHLKISLLHIDVDLYEPTKISLEQFFPLVTRGGIVILDDYGAFAGANKAIDDFFADKRLHIQKLPYSMSISFVEVK